MADKNWINKTQRAEKAKTHAMMISVMAYHHIDESVLHTTEYTGSAEVHTKSRNDNMYVSVEDLDSVSSVFKHDTLWKRLAVLNFASYKNPGGCFLNGSCAQEEALCHHSTLFNVLLEFDQSFYAYNRKHTNCSLYTNRGLYSENIAFFKQETLEQEDLFRTEHTIADVITVAAPNASAAFAYHNISKEENLQALRSRIHFVLDIAEAQRVKILILGAFGCGVFGQDPKVVASIFKEFLETGNYSFEEVYFAVPRSATNKNYEAFVEVFDD